MPYIAAEKKRYPYRRSCIIYDVVSHRLSDHISRKRSFPLLLQFLREPVHGNASPSRLLLILRCASIAPWILRIQNPLYLVAITMRLIRPLANLTIRYRNQPSPLKGRKPPRSWSQTPQTGMNRNTILRRQHETQPFKVHLYGSIKFKSNPLPSMFLRVSLFTRLFVFVLVPPERRRWLQRVKHIKVPDFNGWLKGPNGAIAPS